jgi:GDPmannose 4,6-dehydratase
MKRALVTGITGQDGSYLAELLLEKGYEVYGFMRRTSTDPFARIEDLYVDGKLALRYGNMRDEETIEAVIKEIKPDEVYNLAAQSHVGISFICPKEAHEVNYLGLKCVADSLFAACPNAKLYQASTSEMFGETPPPQSEDSAFNPVSPYAEAKLKAHEYIQELKKKGKFAVSGILFNHESPRRGKHFVTRKLTHSLVKLKLGLQDVVHLGNLEAKRDWGFAGDYVEAMWMMLQQEGPEDYVISTGESHSVRELVEAVASELGMTVTWSGSGVSEVGKDESGQTIIEVNERYYRPREIAFLQGNNSKACEQLGWKPKVSFQELVKMMVESDLKLIAGHADYIHD